MRSRRRRGGIVLALGAAAWALSSTAAPLHAQGPDEPTFLVVKLGDEAATPEMAGDFLSRLEGWLASRVPRFRGARVEGRIANREEEARRIFREATPSLALVPTGIYLGHLREGEPSGRPVAQIPRFGAETERYYLVAAKDGPASLEGLRGRTVRTVFSYHEPYLRRVVFPDRFRPGDAFTLEPAGNLADQVFLLLEGEPEAPAAVLLDEELKRFFEEDDLVWPELRVIWTSDPLPRDLVVTVGAWSDEERSALRDALFSMGKTAEGRQILDLMDSSGFEPVDEELLRRAVRRYDGGS